MSHSHNAENDELTTEKTKSKACHRLKKAGYWRIEIDCASYA